MEAGPGFFAGFIAGLLGVFFGFLLLIAINTLPDPREVVEIIRNYFLASAFLVPIVRAWQETNVH